MPNHPSKYIVESWVETRSPVARTRLIEHYLSTTMPTITAKYMYQRYRSMCSNAIDLDDLIAVAEEAIISAVDTYDPDRGTSLTTWVILKMRNEVLREVRRNDEGSPSDARIVDCDDAILEQFPADIEDPGLIMTNHERSALYSALESLPKELRQVVTYVDLLGMTYRQAAAAMDHQIALGSVYARRQQAIPLLKSALSGVFGDY